MKKMFVVSYAILPGGIVLLAAIITFTACARFQYETSAKKWIKGFTASPETVMMADAESEVRRAEAKCIAERGMAACYYGNYGPPEEMAWKQFRLSHNQQDTLCEINKNIAQIKNSQRLLIKAVKTSN